MKNLTTTAKWLGALDCLLHGPFLDEWRNHGDETCYVLHRLGLPTSISAKLVAAGIPLGLCCNFEDGAWHWKRAFLEQLVTEYHHLFGWEGCPQGLRDLVANAVSLEG